MFPSLKGREKWGKSDAQKSLQLNLPRQRLGRGCGMCWHGWEKGGRYPECGVLCKKAQKQSSKLKNTKRIPFKIILKKQKRINYIKETLFWRYFSQKFRLKTSLQRRRMWISISLMQQIILIDPHLTIPLPFENTTQTRDNNTTFKELKEWKVINFRLNAILQNKRSF